MRSRRWTRSSSAVLVALLATGCAKPRPVIRDTPPVDPLQQLRTDIDALIDQPGHQRGTWGVIVYSLARQERLYERNPRTLLLPASTVKVVTVAAAAEAVGWDYVFETTMFATGPVVNGVLQGDLVIAGSGDPSVLGPAGDDSFDPWIAALQALGITRVDGRVVADDDAIEEPMPGFAWSWEDLGYAYGAVPGALNLSENTLHLIVSPGPMAGAPVVVELPADARGLPIVNRARTSAAGTGENLWPELRPGESGLTLNGTIAAGGTPAVVSISAGNPTKWFARAVRNRVLDAGIDVTGEAIDIDELAVRPSWPQVTTIYTHRSRPLAEIATPLVRDSVNLYAEALLRLATGPHGERTADAGLDAVRARLESWGIPKEGIQIVDGSGLSRRNVVAAETLLTVLQRFHDPSGTSPFMKTLTTAGRDGTLASRMKGTAAEGNAVGKTGTLSNVRTLAGYVNSTDGEPLAFVILANNFEGPGAGVTATVDRIVVRLASFSRGETRALGRRP